MTATCTAQCALPAAQILAAGLSLGLCLNHLDALRRMCQGKQRLAYAKLAVRETQRLIASGAAHRPGRAPTAYRCGLCSSWHVGHQMFGGDGEPPYAAAAAAAVRARLSAEQLNQLCTAWQPGNARRPHRRRAHSGRRPA